jgi:hypothetical protein
MGGLSFLVTHGAAWWLTVVGVFFVLGALGAWRLADRAMRGRARRVREALGDASPAALAQDAGKRVTLIGTLAAVAQPTLDEESGEAPPPDGALAATVAPQGLELVEEATPKARSAAAGGARLALDVGETRVLLDGPVQVLAGSRETERCIGKSAGQPLLWDFAGQLGALPARAFAVRTLAAGDKVIARGMLRHDPDPSDAGSYRAARALFALEVDPSDPDAKVIPLAYAGAPRPLARPRARVALRALAAPLGAIAALALVGEIAVRAGKPGADAIAAATPFRRADALRQLREATPLRVGADGASIERAVALDRLRGRCADAIDDLFEHHRLEASAKMAAECKDRWREGRAWFALAELDRAADAYERAREGDGRLPFSLSEATAYLAANKPERAASALHALSRTWEAGPVARRRLECAALYAEHLAGKADAVDALLARRDESSNGACGLLWSDAQPPEKARYRDYWNWGTGGLLDARATLSALENERATNGGARMLDLSISGGQLVFEPRWFVYAVPPAIAEAAASKLAASGAARLVRARLLLHVARVDSYFGEVSAARARLDEARALLTGARAKYSDAQIRRLQNVSRFYYSSEYEQITDEDREAVAAAAELDELAVARYALDVRAGARDAEAPKIEWVWQLENLNAARAAKIEGDGAALGRLAQRDSRDANRKLWDLVLAQDGPGLVGRLEDKGEDGRGVVDFLGGQPAIREDLARWVRFGYPAACTTCGLYPLANQVVSRRDAAVAAHAADVEAETGAVARRIRALLARRDIAMVLAVVSELSPP